MRVEIVDHVNGNKVLEAKDSSGIIVNDGLNNQWEISVDKFGNLVVNNPFGRIAVIPRVSNEIILESRE